MLKTIFGRYSQLNLNINKKSKILDVGCGFGNNLVPFIDLGCLVRGVEIDREICKITNNILKKNFIKKY